MKVTPGENFGGIFAIGEYERIVGRAIQFHSRHVPYIFQGFADRSVDLRYTTQAVGVLYPPTVDVRLPDLALPKKLRQAFGDFDLSPVRSGLVNAGAFGNGRPFHCSRGHAAGRTGQARYWPAAPPPITPAGKSRWG